MVHSGEHGDYGWVVSDTQIRVLTELVVRFHRGLRLCITSSDSGPLRLGEEELAVGWAALGNTAVSPPLDEALAIPHDQYDEWYLVHNPSGVGGSEVFVNYGSFSLAALTQVEADPSWLAPMQERFWSQVGRLRPESYVAMGDNDVVVSRNHQFIQAVREAAETGTVADRPDMR